MNNKRSGRETSQFKKYKNNITNEIEINSKDLFKLKSNKHKIKNKSKKF